MGTAAAYERLRLSIMNGRPVPGAEVRPEELAGEIGADAESVRLALERLIGEGLVESEDGHGELFRIAPLDKARALDTLDVFQSVVLTAAGRAMGELSASDAARVEGASQRFLAAVAGDDHDAAASAFDDFFTELFATARSRELELVLRPLQARFLRAVRLFVTPQIQLGDFAAPHRLTVSVVVGGDATQLVVQLGRRLDDMRKAIAAAPETPWA
jgi:DNA-binding GntR family transcriptional regulator